MIVKKVDSLRVLIISRILWFDRTKTTAELMNFTTSELMKMYKGLLLELASPVIEKDVA